MLIEIMQDLQRSLASCDLFTKMSGALCVALLLLLELLDSLLDLTERVRLLDLLGRLALLVIRDIRCLVECVGSTALRGIVEMQLLSVDFWLSCQYLRGVRHLGVLAIGAIRGLQIRLGRPVLRGCVEDIQLVSLQSLLFVQFMRRCAGDLSSRLWRHWRIERRLESTRTVVLALHLAFNLAGSIAFNSACQLRLLLGCWRAIQWV